MYMYIVQYTHVHCTYVHVHVVYSIVLFSYNVISNHSTTQVKREE